MKRSWRTTSAGIAAILVALGGAIDAERDGDPETKPDWGTLAAAVIAGIGLLAARDNNVTSKQAGAEK